MAGYPSIQQVKDFNMAPALTLSSTYMAWLLEHVAQQPGLVSSWVCLCFGHAQHGLEMLTWRWLQPGVMQKESGFLICCKEYSVCIVSHPRTIRCFLCPLICLILVNNTNKYFFPFLSKVKYYQNVSYIRMHSANSQIMPYYVFVCILIQSSFSVTAYCL